MIDLPIPTTAVTVAQPEPAPPLITTPARPKRRLVVTCNGGGAPIRLAVYDAADGLVTEVEIDDRAALIAAADLLAAVSNRWPS